MEYTKVYKNITVTVRTPDNIKETLKQEKINYIYDLLTGRKTVTSVTKKIKK